MKALVFAAGLGERMRPLTAHTPKPLLDVGGRPLVAWHLEKLAAIGVRDVVVNTSWLAPRFPEVLGDGARWGLRLHFAYEGPTPLETGGGMWNALLDLAGDDDAPFLAINGDIWTDYDLARLPRAPRGEAHLVLVDNPDHHPGGDFWLHADGHVRSDAGVEPHLRVDAREAMPADGIAHPRDPQRLTFSGIGVYRPAVLHDWRLVIGDAPGANETPPRFKLAPLLRAAMARNAVTGEHHAGRWTDVGTPARLAALDAQLRRADPA